MPRLFPDALYPAIEENLHTLSANSQTSGRVPSFVAAGRSFATLPGKIPDGSDILIPVTALADGNEPQLEKLLDQWHARQTNEIKHLYVGIPSDHYFAPNDLRENPQAKFHNLVAFRHELVEPYVHAFAQRVVLDEIVQYAKDLVEEKITLSVEMAEQLSIGMDAQALLEAKEAGTLNLQHTGAFVTNINAYLPEEEKPAVLRKDAYEPLFKKQAEELLCYMFQAPLYELRERTEARKLREPGEGMLEGMIGAIKELVTDKDRIRAQARNDAIQTRGDKYDRFTPEEIQLRDWAAHELTNQFPILGVNLAQGQSSILLLNNGLNIDHCKVEPDPKRLPPPHTWGLRIPREQRTERPSLIVVGDDRGQAFAVDLPSKRSTLFHEVIHALNPDLQGKLYSDRMDQNVVMRKDMARARKVEGMLQPSSVRQFFTGQPYSAEARELLELASFIKSYSPFVRQHLGQVHPSEVYEPLSPERTLKVVRAIAHQLQHEVIDLPENSPSYKALKAASKKYGDHQGLQDEQLTRYGDLLLQCCATQEDIPAARKLLEKILPPRKGNISKAAGDLFDHLEQVYETAVMHSTKVTDHATTPEPAFFLNGSKFTRTWERPEPEPETALPLPTPPPSIYPVDTEFNDPPIIVVKPTTPPPSSVWQNRISSPEAAKGGHIIS
jgi:hypothetical protein